MTTTKMATTGILDVTVKAAREVTTWDRRGEMEPCARVQGVATVRGRQLVEQLARA